jgi:hypothetical protein
MVQDITLSDCSPSMGAPSPKTGEVLVQAEGTAVLVKQPAPEMSQQQTAYRIKRLSRQKRPTMSLGT